MRKIRMLSALSTVVILSLFYFGTEKADGNERNGYKELSTIVTILQSENIDIEEWSLYAREKVNHFSNLEDVQTFFQQLKEKYPRWTWSTSSEADKWLAIGLNHHPNGIQENIQILSTLTNNHPQIYITYELKGKSEIPKRVQSLRENITMDYSDIFRGNATIFTCVKGKLSDKMDTTLPFTVNYFLDLFKAKEMESITETEFISVSAYSPMLGEGIIIGTDEMNMQLSIRTKGLGAETTLVVGTPIITIEY